MKDLFQRLKKEISKETYLLSCKYIYIINFYVCIRIDCPNMSFKYINICNYISVLLKANINFIKNICTILIIAKKTKFKINLIQFNWFDNSSVKYKVHIESFDWKFLILRIFFNEFYDFRFEFAIGNASENFIDSL